jgi:hypothetical protein
MRSLLCTGRRISRSLGQLSPSQVSDTPQRMSALSFALPSILSTTGEVKVSPQLCTGTLKEEAQEELRREALPTSHTCCTNMHWCEEWLRSTENKTKHLNTQSSNPCGSKVQ